MKGLPLLLCLLHTLLTARTKSRQRLQSRKVPLSFLNQFLADTSTKKIKEMGGIFDETGMDGLEDKDMAMSFNERMRQKSRSAATLSLQADGKEGYSAYGCSPGDEDIPGGQWADYVVLMMNPGTADHLLVKTCVQGREGDDQMAHVAFVIGTDQKCIDRIGLVTNKNTGVDERGNTGVDERGNTRVDEQGNTGVDEQGMSFLQESSRTTESSSSKSTLAKSIAIIQNQMQVIHKQLEKEVPGGSSMQQVKSLVMANSRNIEVLSREVAQSESELGLLRNM